MTGRLLKGLVRPQNWRLLNEETKFSISSSIVLAQHRILQNRTHLPLPRCPGQTAGHVVNVGGEGRPVPWDGGADAEEDAVPRLLCHDAVVPHDPGERSRGVRGIKQLQIIEGVRTNTISHNPPPSSRMDHVHIHAKLPIQNYQKRKNPKDRHLRYRSLFSISVLHPTGIGGPSTKPSQSLTKIL